MPQSRAVKSTAYGFGNTTHPGDEESTRHAGRIVFVELHDGTGRIYLAQAAPAVVAHPIAEGWFPPALGQYNIGPANGTTTGGRGHWCGQREEPPDTPHVQLRYRSDDTVAILTVS